MAETNRRSNIDVFNRGIKSAKTLIKDNIIKRLKDAAEDLIKDAEFAQEYHNLTGNTLTSYAVGIYFQYSLVAIVTIRDVDGDTYKPTGPKLSKGGGWVEVEQFGTGEKVFANTKTFEKTDMDYGYNTSHEFIQNYVPENGGFVIMMCTGTEYSSTLEYLGLNVLTETFQLSPRAFLSNLQKIRL